MNELEKFIEELKEQSFLKNYDGKDYQVINISQEGNLSFKYYKLLDRKIKNSLKEIHILALENGIVPVRYLENVAHYGIENQIRLLKSKVAICGVGKVGSEVAEHLTRLGVGEITLIDTNLLEETDLNSQKNALPEYLMLPRNTVMNMRIRDINAAIEIREYSEGLSENYFKQAIDGYNLVIQTDDSSLSNGEAYKLSLETGIPFVFGVLEGIHGQIVTMKPAEISEQKKILMKDFLHEFKQSNKPTLPHKLSIFTGHLVSEAISIVLKERNESLFSVLFV